MKKLYILRATSDHPSTALEGLEKMLNRHLEDGAELLSPPNLIPYTDAKADFPSRFVAYATVQHETTNSATNVDVP